MSSKNENDSEATFRAAFYPALKDQYALHLKQLFWDCFRSKEPSERDKIDFLYELDQIISGYKKRISDPDYFKRMSDCQIALSNAADLLDSSLKALFRVDASHLELMLALFNELVPISVRRSIARPERKLDWADMLLILQKARFISEAFSSCLLGAGVPNLLGQKRGHPSLPYLWPSLELIEFVEEWTGKPVPYAKAFPKGAGKGGEPDHPACHFIFVALKLIDPKVTPAKAVTSINNARKHRENVREVIFRFRKGGVRAYMKSLMKDDSSRAIGASE